MIWKWIFCNILSRKLCKNVNLFYLNINFLKSQTEKVSHFLMSLMWKLSLLWKMSLLNVTAVEIELAVDIEPAVFIEPAVEIELFL